MTRRARDFYETPPHYVAALLSEVNIFGTVYEPCVGEAAIADALKIGAVNRVITNDIDKKHLADTHHDARCNDAWKHKRLDWVVTNPPFSDELSILDIALDHAPNVAMLARLSFLEPTEDRADFLAQNPPNQIIVLPRYSFRPNDAGKKQTDSVTCCWLVWFEGRQFRRTAIIGRGRSQAEAIVRGLL